MKVPSQHQHRVRVTNIRAIFINIIFLTRLQTQVRFAAKIQEQRKRQAVNISMDRRNVIDSKHVEPLDALSGAGPHLLWRLQKLDKRKCGRLSSSLISKVLRNYVTVQELDHVMKNLGDDVNYIALVSSIASDVDETESLNDNKMSEYVLEKDVLEKDDDDVKSFSYEKEDVKSFSYEKEDVKSFSYEKEIVEKEVVEKEVEAFPPHFEEEEDDDEEEELDLPPSTDVPPPPPPPSTRPPKHQLNRVRDRRKQIDEMQQQLRTRSTPMSRKSNSVKKDLNNTARRHVKNRRVASTVSAGDRRKQYLKRRNKLNRTTIKKKKNSSSTLSDRKRKVKSDMRTPPPSVSKSGSSSTTKTRRPRKVVVEDKTDSAIRSYITRRMRQVSRG